MPTRIVDVNGNELTINNDTYGSISIADNFDATLLASAARSASIVSADQVNIAGAGVNVVVDVTAIASNATVTCTIQGKDVASGKYYTILASTTLSATGTTVLTVHPGLPATANVSANALVPRTWRVSCAYGGSSTITYSVGSSTVT